MCLDSSKVLGVMNPQLCPRVEGCAAAILPHLSPPYEFIYHSIRLASSGLHDICETVLSATRIIPQLEIRSKSLVCTTMEYEMEPTVSAALIRVCDIAQHKGIYIWTSPVPGTGLLKLLDFLCIESYKVSLLCY